MNTPANADHPPSTDRLRLRRLTIDDAPLMLAIWNDPAFVRFVADRGIRTLASAAEEMRAGVLRLYSDYEYGPYAMELKDGRTVIGICGLFRREGLDDPDIGFAVLPTFRGHGYVYEAAGSVMDFACEGLGISRLKAIVSPGNDASVALIKKLGFEFERMHRMPGDDVVALYGIRLRPPREAE